MKRNSKTADPSYGVDVYRGRERAGSIRRKGSLFRALDSDGRSLGSFPNEREAYLKIIGAPRSAEGAGQ